MIIWKRWGIFVIIAFAVGIVPSTLYMDAVGVAKASELTFVQNIVWGLIFTTSTAGINWLLWFLFLRDEGVKIFHDEKGNQFTFNNISSFFFIPNFYWTYILVALGVIFTVMNILNK
ncbi:hypothetical protein [Pseudolactococcus piscium]|uniref:hypothetical protein n=1 Tax=Pseudolactococcus piscium TaxID=1364 RepID=UPI000BDE82FB|nr:hypothetical protein [Lactococcus piscium]